MNSTAPNTDGSLWKAFHFLATLAPSHLTALLLIIHSPLSPCSWKFVQDSNEMKINASNQLNVIKTSCLISHSWLCMTHVSSCVTHQSVPVYHMMSVPVVVTRSSPGTDWSHHSPELSWVAPWHVSIPIPRVAIAHVNIKTNYYQKNIFHAIIYSNKTESVWNLKQLFIEKLIFMLLAQVRLQNFTFGFKTIDTWWGGGVPSYQGIWYMRVWSGLWWTGGHGHWSLVTGHWLTLSSLETTRHFSSKKRHTKGVLKNTLISI